NSPLLFNNYTIILCCIKNSVTISISAKNISIEKDEKNGIIVKIIYLFYLVVCWQTTNNIL
ncbi:MAG: hypothetical protein RR444_08215, partial [Oscillospiraceae bacterium]